MKKYLFQTIRLFGLSLGLLSSNIFVSTPAAAQPSTPSKIAMHNCARPVVKGKISTDEEFIAFDKKVGEYKNCMLVFIEEQNKKAAPYLKAADQITKEFSAYINSSPAVADALKSPPASSR